MADWEEVGEADWMATAVGWAVSVVHTAVRARPAAPEAKVATKAAMVERREEVEVDSAMRELEATATGEGEISSAEAHGRAVGSGRCRRKLGTPLR